MSNFDTVMPKTVHQPSGRALATYTHSEELQPLDQALSTLKEVKSVTSQVPVASVPVASEQVVTAVADLFKDLEAVMSKYKKQMFRDMAKDASVEENSDEPETSKTPKVKGGDEGKSAFIATYMTEAAKKTKEESQADAPPENDIDSDSGDSTDSNDDSD